MRQAHGMVELIRLQYSRTNFYEGNLNGDMISCMWNFTVLLKRLTVNISKYCD